MYTEDLINDPINNCYVKIIRNWMNIDMTRDVFNVCLEECVERTPVMMYGKLVMQPRCSKVFADSTVSGQKYAGTIQKASLWHPIVEDIRNQIAFPYFIPNACLINGYTLPTDYVGFHFDKEMQDPNNTVCTLSVGGSRRFSYKQYNNENVKVETVLNNGDLLYMWGNTNVIWQHSILKPRKKDDSSPRYSLTFRQVKSYDPNQF